ncbi:MAG: response regulator [Chloroflexi bacterium]|nr:response regulator [Chloroflexota bacterium]
MGRQVLVVDDEEIVRRVLCRLLATLGFTPLAVESGDEAVALFRSAPHRYSLVLLDVTMPPPDGEATLRALREIRPGVPVIMMSGYCEEDILSRLAAADHPDDFLEKPFTTTALASKLNAFRAA